ncbi:MAG: DUF4397 domain-containing protein [Ferruginibacter sp.]
MKKLTNCLLLIITVIVTAVSCGKENPAPPKYSSVLYVNASPAIITAPTHSVLIDDSLLTGNLVLGYISTTGYLGLLPGTHTFKVTHNLAPFNTLATNGPSEFAQNKAYTVVGYDSLTTSNSIRTMKLNDDLTVPDVNSAKMRFWQLAPNFPSTTANTIDVTFLRTSVTPNDSVTLAAKSFPGASPIIANYETFTTIPSGTYTVKFKQPASQTGITSTPLTVNRRKIYSLYLTGTAGGRGLGLGLVTHF